MRPPCWLTAAILLVACTGCSLPPIAQGTKRRVKTADIVGRWEYQVEDGGTTVALDFRDDGSFVQAFNPANGRAAHTGRWHLVKNALALATVLMQDGTPHEVTWRIVDGDDESFTIRAMGVPRADPSNTAREVDCVKVLKKQK
ncbi:MAG: hypothetical protein K8T25_10190 [Planctomycetia bacterium]|nr:hypothetical protein [Planctomycetia bacterium]